MGLSPPTRGNRRADARRHRVEGSIPAHAGEPQHPRRRKRFLAVYPRPRGGTLPPSQANRQRPGLSPPTRGNRGRFRRKRLDARSIPAHAGEPTVRARKDGSGEVYPRPRGGTPRCKNEAGEVGGLSPPTRGNLQLQLHGLSYSGSIPAHAGEPSASSSVCRDAGVYPRPRGGTGRAPKRAKPKVGLSPPTRGNPLLAAVVAAEMRSIPAHAGEPYSPHPTAARHRVYPRPRGGTSPTRNEP